MFAFDMFQAHIMYKQINESVFPHQYSNDRKQMVEMNFEFSNIEMPHW